MNRLQIILLLCFTLTTIFFRRTECLLSPSTTSKSLLPRSYSLLPSLSSSCSSANSNHRCIGCSRSTTRPSTLSMSHDGVDSVTIPTTSNVSNISSWKQRLLSSIPNYHSIKSNELDRRILSMAIPSMLNLMVVPIVNAVDTYYVGQLADPFALAAQSAANQCFFSIYFMAAFLPTITAPLVAKAIGTQDWESAKDRVCEGLFLSNVLGGLFTLLLLAFPRSVLRLVLPPGQTG